MMVRPAEALEHALYRGRVGDERAGVRPFGVCCRSRVGHQRSAYVVGDPLDKALVLRRPHVQHAVLDLLDREPVVSVVSVGQKRAQVESGHYETVVAECGRSCQAGPTRNFQLHRFFLLS